MQPRRVRHHLQSPLSTLWWSRFLRRLDPGFEPIAFPMLCPELDQHELGRLNEQDPQIAIAAL